MNRALHTLILASLALNHGASEEKYDSKSLNRLGNERQYEKLPKFSKIIGGLKRQIGTQIKNNPFQEPWEPANQSSNKESHNPVSEAAPVEPTTEKASNTEKHELPLDDSQTKTSSQKTKGPFWGDYPKDGDPLNTRKQERRQASAAKKELIVELFEVSVEQKNSNNEDKTAEKAPETKVETLAETDDGVIEAKEETVAEVVEAKAVTDDGVIEAKAETIAEVVEAKAVTDDDVVEAKVETVAEVVEAKAETDDGVVEAKAETIAEVSNDTNEPITQTSEANTAPKLKPTQRPTRESHSKEKLTCEVPSRILNFVQRPEKAELPSKRSRRASSTQNTPKAPQLEAKTPQVLNVQLHQTSSKLHIIPPANPVHIPNFPRYYEMQNKVEDQADAEHPRRILRKKESDGDTLGEVIKHISYP
jgi:hypothetical protein